jgi:hypothetical protein
MIEATHRLHPKYAKRHYEDFAAILAELRRCQYDRCTLDAIESELVRLFGRDNGRFSASRFIDAAQAPRLHSEAVVRRAAE